MLKLMLKLMLNVSVIQRFGFNLGFKSKSREAGGNGDTLALQGTNEGAVMVSTGALGTAWRRVNQNEDKRVRDLGVLYTAIS